MERWKDVEAEAGNKVRRGGDESEDRHGRKRRRKEVM
jgi:hypothetical protein